MISKFCIIFVPQAVNGQIFGWGEIIEERWNLKLQIKYQSVMH